MVEITEELIKSELTNHGGEFKPSQVKLSIPIVRRLYKKMVYGIKFDSIKVCDDLIIDGHHRYVSAVLAKHKLGTIPSSKTSASIAYNWQEVLFLEEEWDTEHRIRRANEIDAQFNDLPIDVLENLMKSIE